jgi:hypothetical protein
MKVHYAAHCCLEYHRANSKKSTTKNYEILLAIFNSDFTLFQILVRKVSFWGHQFLSENLNVKQHASIHAA